MTGPIWADPAVRAAVRAELDRGPACPVCGDRDCRVEASCRVTDADPDPDRRPDAPRYSRYGQ